MLEIREVPAEAIGEVEGPAIAAGEREVNKGGSGGWWVEIEGW